MVDRGSLHVCFEALQLGLARLTSACPQILFFIPPGQELANSWVAQKRHQNEPNLAIV